jgi:hypothetical protein
LDGVARNWQATQVPEVRSTFVRVAATAFNFLSTQVISQRNREFTMQLQHLVQRWEATPGSRREIEGQIAGRISTRQALIRHLAEHKVPTLMELWAANCCPPAAPGTPSLDGRPTIHHVLLPIAVSARHASCWLFVVGAGCCVSHDAAHCSWWEALVKASTLATFAAMPTTSKPQNLAPITPSTCPSLSAAIPASQPGS